MKIFRNGKKNVTKMCNMQVATGVLLFLGFAVLASYALFLKCDLEVLWAGVPPPLRCVFLCFMPLAAIGFVYVAITWTLNSPNGWVSSSFTYIMIAFCVFAILSFRTSGKVEKVKRPRS